VPRVTLRAVRWPRDYLDAARARARRIVLGVWLGRGEGGLVRLGSEYGGWWVPEASLRQGAVAYCAGAGEDVTFDLALLERGLRVTTFDPTPRARIHVEQLGERGSGLRFVALGWWDEEAELRFYAPRDSAHVSHSALNLQRTADYFVAKVKPVHQLAAELGDERIEIIKMDIEGAEQRVIPSLLDHQLLPQVLCVEFDQPQSLLGMIRIISRLRKTGYRVAKLDRWDFTFVR
jgi:FkbM family methyltransferase